MNKNSSRQNLSSFFTIIYKFFLPIVWISGFGIATILVIVSEPRKAGGFIIGLLIGLSLLYFFCIPLKFVETDEQFLYISNTRKVIQIPFSEIQDIGEFSFINIRPVWIKFKISTEFGFTIIFLPYYDSESSFMTTHPVVNKLKELAKLR